MCIAFSISTLTGWQGLPRLPSQGEIEKRPKETGCSQFQGETLSSEVLFEIVNNGQNGENAHLFQWLIALSKFLLAGRPPVCD